MPDRAPVYHETECDYCIGPSQSHSLVLCPVCEAIETEARGALEHNFMIAAALRLLERGELNAKQVQRRIERWTA